MSSNSTLLGVVVLARHGDRQGFYQDPLTYDSSNTAITPLGNVSPHILSFLPRPLFNLFLRQKNSNSASSFALSISHRTPLF